MSRLSPHHCPSPALQPCPTACTHHVICSQEEVHKHIANIHDQHCSELVNKGLNMTVDLYNKNTLNEDRIQRLEAELQLTKKLLFEAQQEQQDTQSKLELARSTSPPTNVGFQWMKRDKDSREEAAAASILKMSRELKEVSRSPSRAPSARQISPRVPTVQERATSPATRYTLPACMPALSVAAPCRRAREPKFRDTECKLSGPCLRRWLRERRVLCLQHLMPGRKNSIQLKQSSQYGIK